jgi:hypothetical protein
MFTLSSAMYIVPAPLTVFTVILLMIIAILLAWGERKQWIKKIINF